MLRPDAYYIGGYLRRQNIVERNSREPGDRVYFCNRDIGECPPPPPLPHFYPFELQNTNDVLGSLKNGRQKQRRIFRETKNC